MSAVARWGRRAWVPLACGIPVMGLAVAYLVLAVTSATLDFVTAATIAAASAYGISGTLGWLRRRDSWTGPVMIGAGYLMFVGALERFTDNGALFAIGNTLNGLQEVAIGYLLLTYPSGKPMRGPTGLLARVILFTPLLSVGDLLTRQTTAACFADACASEPNPFLVADLGTFFADLTRVAIGIFAVAVLAALSWRYLSAHGASRRVLAPLVIAGVLAGGAEALRPFLAGEREIRAVLFWTGQMLIPLALGIGFLRSRMARAGVADLVMHVGERPSVHDLDRAVRRTLHDPSARILHWSGSANAYLDAHGAAASLPHGKERQVTVIAGERGPLAAIEHDPVLAEEGDLLPSVVAAVRIVLENDRLATSVQAQAADAARLPTGVITFMYTDIEGSTELLDQLREQYAVLVRDLRSVLRRATREAGGTEIDSRADEFFAAIPDAVRAVRAALEVQRDIGARSWPDDVRLQIRIGLHTGEPDLMPDGYVGLDVHLAARVGSAGNGGQVVVSETTWAAVHGPVPGAALGPVPDAMHNQLGGLSFMDLGRYQLKGIPTQMRLYQVSVPGMAVEFGPLRAERVAGAAAAPLEEVAPALDR